MNKQELTLKHIKTVASLIIDDAPASINDADAAAAVLWFHAAGYEIQIGRRNEYGEMVVHFSAEQPEPPCGWKQK